MNDEKTSLASLTLLADAFTELERRADRVTAEATYVPPATGQRRRWPVVAAAAAGVAVVATGAAVLAQSGGSSSRPTAGGSSTAASTPVSSSPSTAPTAQRDLLVPSSPREIARRFRAVLADAVGPTATFTVTGTGHAVQVTVPPAPGQSAKVRTPNSGSTPNGAAIVGQLTVGGVTGGFDVQMLKANDVARASCDTRKHCSLRILSDGSTLAVGRARLADGGLTYVADFVRADGAEVLMHVSNQRDPKGESAVVGPHPPLTTAQLGAVVSSKYW